MKCIHHGRTCTDEDSGINLTYIGLLMGEDNQQHHVYRCLTCGYTELVPPLSVGQIPLMNDGLELDCPTVGQEGE